MSRRATVVVQVSAFMGSVLRSIGRFGPFLVAAVHLASCTVGDRGHAEAEAAVRNYLARLSEAYRSGDESLVDPLVSEQQGRKLIGLIGVKLDAGVVLDAKLLDLQFSRVEPAGDGWIVETRERWYYADRQIGTGKQVGQDSTDSYAMRYRFVRKDGRLVLEDLEFVAEPRVGRTSTPTPTDVRVLHGLPPAVEAGGSTAAGPPQPAVPPTVPPGHPPTPGGPGMQPPPGHPPVPGGSGAAGSRHP